MEFLGAPQKFHGGLIPHPQDSKPLPMSGNTPPESGFAEMVESCIDSVWTLELLLLLHAQPDRFWATVEIVAELRSSELVVAQSLRALLNAGLAIAESDGKVRFAAASADLTSFVEKLAAEYRSRPGQIRRLIVSRSSSKLMSFSDAFVLRKTTL
jgi:hypothetical protein